MDHDCRQRNGKGYYRDCALLDEPNFQFAYIETMIEMVKQVFHRFATGDIVYMPLDKFLNV